VVVPRSLVPDLIERVEEIGRRLKTFVVNFGHAGNGNIHPAIIDAMKKIKKTFDPNNILNPGKMFS
jgi:glycolate oxidase